MTCVVCGYPDASTLCPRCGTDLRLLAGGSGEARLEIRPLERSSQGFAERADRKAGKRLV